MPSNEHQQRGGVPETGMKGFSVKLCPFCNSKPWHKNYTDFGTVVSCSNRDCFIYNKWCPVEQWNTRSFGWAVFSFSDPTVVTIQGTKGMVERTILCLVKDRYVKILDGIKPIKYKQSQSDVMFEATVETHEFISQSSE